MTKAKNNFIKIAFLRICAILSNVIGLTSEFSFKNFFCKALNILDIFWKKIWCNDNADEKGKAIEKGRKILKENEDKSSILKILKKWTREERELFKNIKDSEIEIKDLFNA